MILWRKLILLCLLFNGLTCAVAQTIEHEQNIYLKPVTFNRLHVEACAGLGISHLDKRYAQKPLHSFYSEVDLVIPLNYRVRLKTGLTYQVLGSVITYDLPDGLATATRRLPYLSAQVMTSYNLSRAKSRVQLELQGGVFAGRKLNDETVNRLPNMPDKHDKSIESTIDFNGGIVVGPSASVAINRKHRIGVKLLYHQGVIDIRTPAAKRNARTNPQFTRAFTIGSYLSF